MTQPPPPENSNSLNRRRFIGAIGAAAASTALFPKIAGALAMARSCIKTRSAT